MREKNKNKREDNLKKNQRKIDKKNSQQIDERRWRQNWFEQQQFHDEENKLLIQHLFFFRKIMLKINE